MYLLKSTPYKGSQLTRFSPSLNAVCGPFERGRSPDFLTVPYVVGWATPAVTYGDDVYGIDGCPVFRSRLVLGSGWAPARSGTSYGGRIHAGGACGIRSAVEYRPWYRSRDGRGLAGGPLQRNRHGWGGEGIHSDGRSRAGEAIQQVDVRRLEPPSRGVLPGGPQRTKQCWYIGLGIP
jgi:hypothetical protein